MVKYFLVVNILKGSCAHFRNKSEVMQLGRDIFIA